MRVIITLACSDCKSRNYTTEKNKQKTQERIAVKKYCRFCKKHTEHKEVK
ncbi:50S ribosomal protein L33 [bacterium]|nr:50S ribosomal protein L33 [bacterium]